MKTTNTAEYLRKGLFNIARLIPTCTPLEFRVAFHKEAHSYLAVEYPEGYKIVLKKDGTVLCSVVEDGIKQNFKLHSVVDENRLV